MLCESVLILLVEGGTLGQDAVVDAIETVIDVKQEIAGVTESVVVSVASIGLLRGVARSISAATVPPSPTILSPV